MVGGQHKATITIIPGDGGAFTGSIVSPDFGTGAITEGVQAGSSLQGKVSLDGYHAKFAAQLDGDKISGTLRCGWFFKEEFTGAQTQ